MTCLPIKATSNSFCPSSIHYLNLVKWTIFYEHDRVTASRLSLFLILNGDQVFWKICCWISSFFPWEKDKFLNIWYQREMLISHCVVCIAAMPYGRYDNKQLTHMQGELWLLEPLALETLQPQRSWVRQMSKSLKNKAAQKIRLVTMQTPKSHDTTAYLYSTQIL